MPAWLTPTFITGVLAAIAAGLAVLGHPISAADQGILASSLPAGIAAVASLVSVIAHVVDKKST